LENNQPLLYREISGYIGGGLNIEMRKRGDFSKEYIMDEIFFHPFIPKTERDIVLYRGVSQIEFLKYTQCINSECILIDPACLSTTYDIKTAHYFQKIQGKGLVEQKHDYRLTHKRDIKDNRNYPYAIGLRGSNISRKFIDIIRRLPFLEQIPNVLLKIYVPAGTPYILGKPDEQEIILPPGLGCVIDSKEAVVTKNGDIVNIVNLYAKYTNLFITYPKQDIDKWQSNIMNRVKKYKINIDYLDNLEDIIQDLTIVKNLFSNVQ
jgi:hypothetical protein